MVDTIPDDAVVVLALTSVDLDQQGFLVTTVTVITRRMVGIARRGESFVLGRSSPGLRLRKSPGISYRNLRSSGLSC